MNKQVLTLKGFPQQLIETTWESVQLQSPAGFQRLAVSVYDAPCTLYCYREQGALLDRILEDGKYAPKDVLAVEFGQYVQDFLDNDKSISPPKVQLLYIYGIGEETTNTTFSDKVLSGLVKGNMLSGNTTVITSDLIMGGIFTRSYPITEAHIDQKLHIVR